MSPNPEACDEELPFREGQLIKVRPYIFLNGECGGVAGEVRQVCGGDFVDRILSNFEA